MDVKVNCNGIVERELDKSARVLEKVTESDVLTLNAPLIGVLDDYVKDFIENLKQRTTKRNKLTVILTTTGGYIEVVHHIVDTIRHHYDFVSFMVPN